MLDIKFLRENPDVVKENIKKKFQDSKLALVDEVIELDAKSRAVKTEMKELAKKFIDKECVISSFDGSHQYEGVIKEVTDGAILVEKDGKIEVLNLDFVIRIREYPRNKNGKKKAIVVD